MFIDIKKNVNKVCNYFMRRPGPYRAASGLLALCVISTFLASCIFSSGIPDVDIGEFEKLIANEQRLVIVDNRTAGEYGSGHIPGAIHIPREEFFNIASLLPEKKDTPIVFYCRGYS